MTAKFVVYYDRAKKFRFRLVAPNGEIIAVGEDYERKASCLNGIRSIQKNAPIAVIEDETLKKEVPEKKPVKKGPVKKGPAKKGPAKKTAVKKAAVKKTTSR